MADWFIDGLRYRTSAESKVWSDGGMVSFKAVVWRERQHRRDRHGQFTDTFGSDIPTASAAAPGVHAPTKPSTPGKPGPKDRLGREIKPGSKVTFGSNSVYTVLNSTAKGQVRLQHPDGTKRSVEASSLSVVSHPDGTPARGDGLPYLKTTADLKAGDRIPQGRDNGYVVTGGGTRKGLIEGAPADLLLVPVADLDGNQHELAWRINDLHTVYPDGLDLPGQTTRRETEETKPSTLKPGETFSFAVGGMHQPVYTVESVSAPRQVTSRSQDARGNATERTFSVVDLSLRTSDGDLVEGSFEDSGQARVTRKPAAKKGEPPFVPAKAVQVGDTIVDPESRGNGMLTVTAVTGEPQMSQDFGVTHDSLLTLRDEQGNIRKIYNRSDWAGVQRAAQANPPAVQPKPAPPAELKDPLPLPKGTPTVKPILYTEDKQDIIDMGFEADPTQSEAVRQGTARIRAKQALTAEQLSGLADAVRVYNERPDVLPGKRRSNVRVANWLDAAAAEIQGREAPALPNRQGVEKVKPEDLNRGDTVALVNRDGVPDIVTVKSAKKNSWGVVVLDLEHPDGRKETRAVLGKSAAYLLPDLPPPVEVRPPGNPREHIHPDRLRPGDIIEQKGIPYMGGSSYTVRETSQTSAYGWTVKMQPNWLEDGKKPALFDFFLHLPDGQQAIIRTDRGEGSAKQPWDEVMPSENPIPISGGEIKVGDRVQIKPQSNYASEASGSVLEVEAETGPHGDRFKVLIREDNGQETFKRVFPEDSVTRLVAADENAEERLRQQKAVSLQNRLRGQFADGLAKYQTLVRNKAIDEATGMHDPERAAQAVTNVMSSGTLPATSFSGLIAGSLGPDLSYADRVALGNSFEPIAEDLAGRELMSVAASIRAAVPLPGESKKDALDRTLETLRKAEPNRDANRTAADSIARLLPELDKARGGPVAQPKLPDMPKGANLAARVEAYRKAIGGNFGKRPVTRALPRVTTLADLEAGVVPHVDMVTEYVPDESPDGGPGAFAMKHLEILRAAGKDLNQEVKGRIQDQRVADEREARDLLKAQERNRDELAAAFDKQLDAVGGYRDQLARKFGYDDWEGLLIARAKARKKEGDYGPTVKRLMKLGTDIQAMAERKADAEEAEVIRLQNEAFALNNKINGLNYKENIARRKAVLSLISDVRGEPMGGVLDHDIVGPGPGDRKDTKTPDKGDRAELKSAMQFATDAYPASWMERIRKRGRYQVQLVTRGFHSETRKVIALSPDQANSSEAGRYGEVAVHELGHGMEQAIPGLLAAENAFMWARTARGEVGSRTQPKTTDIYKPKPGEKAEKGWKDDFANHYSGKTYGGYAFELFTMGVQELTGGGKGHLDEDYTNWLLGSLALL